MWVRNWNKIPAIRALLNIIIKNKKDMKRIIQIYILLIVSAVYTSGQELFIEAELFEQKGGWVADAQFMDQMGSPYLLAHGMGTPVADASTKVTFPSTGTYHAWVRTYNWNSPWDASKAPGVFQLLVNGKPTVDKLGDVPSRWGWQYAGKMEINKKENRIALHDLTGFSGRCDAIAFDKDEYLVLPDGGTALSALRREKTGVKLTDANEKYELVVVGAGVAGLCAAVSAARMGVKTLLIHNRPVIGGNNSSEVGVGISGGIQLAPYEKIGNIVAELGNAFTNEGRIMEILNKEELLTLVLNQHVTGVEMEGTNIHAVIAKNIATNNEHRYEGIYYSDCTGDANLGYLAGADFRMGRETRAEFNEELAPEIKSNLSYGSSLKWSASAKDRKTDFPETPWAVQFTEATCKKVTKSQWYWETGFYKNQIEDAEYIRDYWFRVIYGNWSYLKNKSVSKADFADADLDNVSFVIGKRESRRLMGDVIFTQNDIEGDWKNFNDSTVVCTYTIDQHFPHPENTFFFPGEEFQAIQKHNYNPMGPVAKKVAGENVNLPYLLPYRSLYSRNVTNMFMAGRNISATRMAMTSFRVQGSTGMMGEVVGIAAYLCKTHRCFPRELYNRHVDELKAYLKMGVPNKNELIIKPNHH